MPRKRFEGIDVHIPEDFAYSVHGPDWWRGAATSDYVRELLAERVRLGYPLSLFCVRKYGECNRDNNEIPDELYSLNADEWLKQNLTQRHE